MKTRNVVLMVVAVLVLALAPTVQALNISLDPMTSGNILDPTRNPLVGPGRWHDERDGVWPPVNSALKESAFSHDGDGSMMIDYSYWAGGGPAPAGDPYDRVPRGYFEGTDNYASPLPDLDSSMSFTFWWYKGDAGPQHVRELQLYSPGGMARFAVANGGEATVGDIHYTGMVPGTWQYVIAPVSSFVTEGAFDWTAVDTIDFWVSAWHQDWAEVPPGSGHWEPIEEQLMPTGMPLYIDDVRLIPEPATMSLLGLGALALLKRRKT